IINQTTVRRIDKGETLDLSKLEVEHLENHRRQIGADNLSIGELRTVQEIGFVIEAKTNTLGNPTTTALALIGTGLGDGFDRQSLNLRAVAVTTDPGLTWVNDVTNARHRQRGFRHVGRQNNAAPAMGLKDPILL